MKSQSVNSLHFDVNSRVHCAIPPCITRKTKYSDKYLRQYLYVIPLDRLENNFFTFPRFSSTLLRGN